MRLQLMGKTMHLSTLTIAERERLAYIEGFTEAANLLARLDDCHEALARAMADYDCMKTDLEWHRRRLAALGDLC